MGLSLSYALSITNLLSGLIVSFAQIEMQLVSIERTEEYSTNIPQEPQEARTQFRGVIYIWVALYRSKLAIIPQDPLFSSTVQENLDPHGLHLDFRLLDALEQCRKKILSLMFFFFFALSVSPITGGLDSEDGKRGSLCLWARGSYCVFPVLFLQRLMYKTSA